MQWKKDPNVKYTDLCIYIDENIPNIINGDHPDIENKVYNYLWLLVKALAIKGRMFQNFQDYDGYAFYSATRLFFALKKNYINQGKTIKGKEIRPIKSCLNYTKALLYPMKVEYQREAYNEIISEEVISQKFDAFTYKEKLKDEARYSQGVYDKISDYIYDVFLNIDALIDQVMQKSPFLANTVDYKKIKISLLLNCLNDLKVNKIFNQDPTVVLLWKLPKSLSGYVRVLLKELYAAIKVEIMDCAASASIEDDLLEKLISSPEGDYKDYEN